MKAWSFRTRLTLRWTVAFGVIMAVGSVIVWAGIRAFLVYDLDAQLRTLAATEMASVLDAGDLHIHEFPAAVFSDESHVDKFVQILTPDGHVVLESGRLWPRPSLLSPEQIRSALGGSAPIFAVNAFGWQGRMIALATGEDESRRVVAVGVYTDRLDRVLGRIGGLLAVSWFLGVTLTALVGFVIASRALVPIERITHRAAAIARGNFSARLDPPATDDEIGTMTRLLNEMLERLHAALQANRLFAADASHELRGPLTAMLGELDVTLKRDRTSTEYHETLTVVRERLRDVVAIAEDLMLLVRAQEGQQSRIHEVPIAPMLTHAAAEVRPAAAQRGIEVRLDTPPDLVAYGVEHLLTPVFDNLLRNAVQYNRDSGRVVVTGYASDPDGDWHAGYVTIEVSDTGAGIGDADRERVFERFYRTDRSRSRRTGGTGLGLSICREVVTLFGGTIRVRDSSPEGTVFEVRLPGGHASAAAATPLAS